MPQHAAGPETLEGTSRQCPYVGLTPFKEAHEQYFFGRDVERDVIAANLATSRLTILYARSGVGKSSVLRAGVLPLARRRAEERFADLKTPRVATAYVSGWSGDPLAEVARCVVAAVGSTPGARPVPTVAGARLDPQWLASTIRASGVSGVHLILDQFEEYFRYHGQEPDDESLVGVLSQILTDHDLRRVTLLLSIREEALASLDRFKGRVPNVFNNYYRLPPLTRAAARAAIERPLPVFNTLVRPEERMAIEPALVNAVLDQSVSTDADEPADVGQRPGVEADEIEAPYLQLVLTTLWNQDRAEGSSTLRLATLERLGGAKQIVRRHLTAVMEALSPAEQDVAAGTFRRLVTSGGDKYALTASALAEDLDGVPADQVRSVLEALSGGERRILRPVAAPAGHGGEPRYEIAHDVLGPAVLEWRKQHVAEQQRRADRAVLDAQRRTLRRTRMVAAGLAALLVAVMGLGGLAMVLRSQADAAATRAEAALGEARQQAHLREASEKLASDPTASLRLAVAAHREDPDPQTEGAVLQASEEPRYAIVGGTDQDPATHMVLTPDRTRFVALRSTDQLLTGVVEEASSGPWVRITGLDHAGSVYDSALDADASRLALTWFEGGGVVVDTATGQAILNWEDNGPSKAVFVPSAAGAPVVITTQDGESLVFDATTGELAGPLDSTSTALATATVGPWFATLDRDRRLRVWDVDSRTAVRTSAPIPDPNALPLEHVRLTGFDSDDDQDGTLVAVAAPSFAELAVLVWRWERGDTQVSVVEGPVQQQVNDVTVDPRHQFVTVAYDKSVRQLDLRSQRWRAAPEYPQLPEQAEAVTTATTGRSAGKRILTGGADGRIRFWSAPSPGSPMYEFLGHQGPIEALSWSGRAAGLAGRQIASFGTDGTVRFWEIPDIHRVPDHREPVTGISRFPDTDLFATTSSDRASLVQVNADGTLTVAEEYLRPPAGARFRQVVLREADRSEAVVLLEGDDAPRVMRWTADGGASVAEFEAISGAHIVSITAVADLVLGVDSFGSVATWDASGSLVEGMGGAGLLTRENRFSEFAGDPTGRWLAGSSGLGIAVTDLDDPQGVAQEAALPQGSTAAPLQAGAQRFGALAFSGDGRRLAGVDELGQMYVWDVTDAGIALAGQEPISFPGGLPGRPALNTDGTLLAAGNGEGLIQVWDVASGQVIFRALRHSGSVNDVQFADDDSMLLTASDDTTAAVFPCRACSDRQAAVDAAVEWVDAHPAP